MALRVNRSVQSYPQGSAAEHQCKRRHHHQQDNPLRVDPWSGIRLVFGAHHEMTKVSASNAVMASRATMIPSSDLFAARLMAKGAQIRGA
jgi:hypothetical protein